MKDYIIKSFAVDSKGQYHTFRKKVAMILILCMMFSMVMGTNVLKASAAATSVTVSLDYKEETITVTAGPSNSNKLYYSKDGMKTWNLIESPDAISSDSSKLSIKFDMTPLLSSRAVMLYFRGNLDETPVSKELTVEDKSLKAVYQVDNGVGKVFLSGTTGPFQYRKGTNGSWVDLSSTYLATSMYEMNGATLYFRTSPQAEKRGGKIITVRIPKKPTAPSVKLDGGKLCISGLKNGVTEYRVGNETVWTKFTAYDTKQSTLDLNYLFGKAANEKLPAGLIEFRTAATEKKVASYAKIIEVPEQPSAPASSTFQVSGTTITINDTDNKRAYEYSVVKASQSFDLKKAKWTSATSARPITLKNVLNGDKVYIRLKSTTIKETKLVVPASPYYIITIGS